MLNDRDLEHIRSNRDSITQLRTVPVILFRETTTATVDPLTGELIPGAYGQETADCTWSNMTSAGPGNPDITMVGGIMAEAGDAIANFDIAVNLEGVDRVQHEGEFWRIRAKDEIGLGVPNRHYVLLRRVT